MAAAATPRSGGGALPWRSHAVDAAQRRREPVATPRNAAHRMPEQEKVMWRSADAIHLQYLVYNKFGARNIEFTNNTPRHLAGNLSAPFG